MRTLTITVDTSALKREVDRARRARQAFKVMIEAVGMTPDQVWAVYNARGGMDPRYESEAARDEHLRVLLRLQGDRGRAAVSGFLAGWARHRGGNEPVEPFAWSLGDTLYVTHDSFPHHREERTMNEPRTYVVGLPVIVRVEEIEDHTDNGIRPTRYITVEVDTSDLGTSALYEAVENSGVDADDEQITADADAIDAWLITHEVRDEGAVE